MRFLRVNNKQSPDSFRLEDPVQLWIRQFDYAQRGEVRDQNENSRYMGFTLKE